MNYSSTIVTTTVTTTVTITVTNEKDIGIPVNMVQFYEYVLFAIFFLSDTLSYYGIKLLSKTFNSPQNVPCSYKVIKKMLEIKISFTVVYILYWIVTTLWSFFQFEDNDMIEQPCTE